MFRSKPCRHGEHVTWRLGLVRVIFEGLDNRHLPLWLALVAVLLTLPVVSEGLYLDDWLIWARLADQARIDERLQRTGWVQPENSGLTDVIKNLWCVSDETKTLMTSGLLPWWTSTDIRLCFFQPLSVLTYVADYRLWPDSPALMHLHSILWFGAAVFAVAVLYRNLSASAMVAGVAALLYILDENSIFSLWFIAIRNTPISLFFGVMALLCHHWWRKHRSRACAVLSPVLLACCLLSKEFGLSIMAYFLSYAFFVDTDKWYRRALSLVPTLTVVVVWKITYGLLGYGVANNGFYVDPVAEPWAFVTGLVERGPLVLFSQWSIEPLVIYTGLRTYWQQLNWFAAVLFIAVIFSILFPLIRRDRTARFWGTGMLLSIVPACSTSFLDGRVLFWVSIGAMGLMAQFIVGSLDKGAWRPNKRSWRIAAWSLCLMLVFTHVLGAVVLRFVGLHGLSVIKEAMIERFVNVGTERTLSEQSLVVVNAPSPAIFVYVPFVRAMRGDPLPEHTRVLAPAFGAIRVVRSGEKELVLHSLGDSLMSIAGPRGEPPFSSILRYTHDVYPAKRVMTLFRSEKCGMTIGERIMLSDVTAHVSAVGEDGFPKEVSFEFRVPLDDPSVKWLKWDWRSMSYQRLRVPDVGESVIVPGPY